MTMLNLNEDVEWYEVEWFEWEIINYVKGNENVF